MRFSKNVHLTNHDDDDDYLNYALISKVCYLAVIEGMLRWAPCTFNQQALATSLKKLWENAIEKSVLLRAATISNNSGHDENDDAMLKVLALSLIQSNNIFMNCVKLDWLKGYAFCRAALQGVTANVKDINKYSYPALVIIKNAGSVTDSRGQTMKPPFQYDPFIYFHIGTKELFVLVTKSNHNLTSSNNRFKDLLYYFVIQQKNVHILRNLAPTMMSNEWNYYVEKWNYHIPPNFPLDIMPQLMKGCGNVNRVWQNLPQKFKQDPQVVISAMHRRYCIRYGYSKDLTCIDCYFTAPLETQLHPSVLHALFSNQYSNRIFMKPQYHFEFVKKLFGFFKTQVSNHQSWTQIKYTLLAHFFKSWQGPRKVESSLEFIRSTGNRKEFTSKVLHLILEIFKKSPTITKRSLHKFAHSILPLHLIEDEVVLRDVIEAMPEFGLVLTRNYWSKHLSILERFMNNFPNDSYYHLAYCDLLSRSLKYSQEKSKKLKDCAKHY
ncbi:hypothetical protein C9374_009506 [Naegleria lovaniensis]|uniref:Uncharacterized protein n=1 Tax=Naegleria lovaniensis TaxID=51637 RepID=A0AA88H3F1_NAELO|nr:uncharacterized protein C9374_009506 [Naegleria lovaniensis]KAG2392929.1 hypothetical protein C9374_009506 [Naegleria lovaniensis]